MNWKAEEDKPERKKTDLFLAFWTLNSDAAAVFYICSSKYYKILAHGVFCSVAPVPLFAK